MGGTWARLGAADRGDFGARMKRVLLVAPADALLPGVSAEVQNVVNSGLRVHLMSNNVTEDTLGETLGAGDYRTLWIASHMDGNGRIQLSDGATVDAITLTQMLRGTTIELVFLNSCSSLQAAQDLQVEADVAVIATVVDVPDQVAYRTGTLFALRLAINGDYRTAYDLSKPGRNRMYIFLDNLRKWRRVNEEILKVLHSIQQELSRIATGLGLEDRREADAEISNHYMIVIITAAILLSASIFFLAIRLNGG